ncbi:MAG: amylo-alpha-1,6-glucosidase [Candidatus Eisenbacteria bacterium]
MLSLGTRMLDAIHERADRTSVLTDPVQHIESGPDALRVAAGLVTLRAFGPARDIARGYLAYIDEGLAPERFDEQGFPHYESPETSLWLVHVVDLLSRRDAESEETQTFLRDGAFRVLEGVLQHLRAGSRHGVHCDRDGFLWAGEGLAARCRADLNALWYHALVAMSQLAKQAGRRENAAYSMAWARELQRAYVDRFWDEASGCLFAELSHVGPLRGLTPSQLYAVSLPPMLLPPDKCVRLVDTVTRELWTPRGLHPRPLDGPPEPAWLGTWASASLRAHQRDHATEARVRAALETYAEIGEGPAAELSARGAADLLRAWIEEVDHTAVPAS